MADHKTFTDGGVKWLLQKIKSVQTAVTQMENGKTLKRLDGTNLSVWYNDDVVTIRFQATDQTPQNGSNTVFVLPSNIKYIQWNMYVVCSVFDQNWYPADTCRVNISETGIDVRFRSGVSTANKVQIIGTVTLPRAFVTIS